MMSDSGFRLRAFVALMAAALVGMSTAASAQRAPARAGQGTSPAELQRMFDAYALIQAQDQLKIDDSHYAQFLTRFKALQDVRQRAVVERAQILQDLRRLTASDPVDEAQVKQKLQDLDALDTRTAGAVRDAYAGIDAVLDVRQQARFRIFEEEMERRKVDLLVRARQANRRQQPAAGR
jgi:Spy/CpxP family protein refolding chaperone